MKDVKQKEKKAEAILNTALPRVIDSTVFWFILKYECNPKDRREKNQLEVYR